MYEWICVSYHDNQLIKSNVDCVTCVLILMTCNIIGYHVLKTAIQDVLLTNICHSIGTHYPLYMCNVFNIFFIFIQTIHYTYYTYMKLYEWLLMKGLITTNINKTWNDEKY